MNTLMGDACHTGHSKRKIPIFHLSIRKRGCNTVRLKQKQSQSRSILLGSCTGMYLDRVAAAEASSVVHVLLLHTTFNLLLTNCLSLK